MLYTQMDMMAEDNGSETVIQYLTDRWAAHDKGAHVLAS